jgi:hypothetical protein
MAPYALRSLAILSLLGASISAYSCNSGAGDSDGLGGLGGASSGGTGSGSGGDVGDIGEACSEPAGSGCTAGISYCAAFAGFPVDESAECYGQEPTEFVECAPVTMNCGGAEWLGRDPDGQLWQFWNSCMPFEWSKEGPSSLSACGLGGAGGLGGAAP